MAKRKNLYKYVHEIQEWDFATHNILNVIVGQLKEKRGKEHSESIESLIYIFSENFPRYLSIETKVSKYIKYPCFDVEKLLSIWKIAWKGVCNAAFKNPTYPKYDEAIGILEEGKSFGIINDFESIKEDFTKKWEHCRLNREPNCVHQIPEEAKFN